MKITAVQDLTSLKGYKLNDQFFIPYEGNLSFDPTNQELSYIRAYIEQGGYVQPEFTFEQILERKKNDKIIKLKDNLNLILQKPHILQNVKQINQNFETIKYTNAVFIISDASSLRSSDTILSVGSFLKNRSTMKLLCENIQSLCKILENIKLIPADTKNLFIYDEIESKVNNLSLTSDFNINEKLNIPYSTKTINGEDITILLDFNTIQDIFSHIFNRVVTSQKLYDIIEQQILSAKTTEEIDKIDINFQ